MSEQGEAPKHKLEDRERVSNALWESLDRRVVNLKAKMDDHGSGYNRQNCPNATPGLTNYQNTTCQKLFTSNTTSVQLLQ